MSDEDVAKLVRGIVKSGHHSALEHAVFSFAVDGVSRACTHQLVRHRVASYNQQSQRYVNFSAADSFVVPPSVSANAEAKAIFLEAMRTPAWPTTGWSRSAWPRGAARRACRRTPASCCPTPPRPRSSSR